MKSKRLLFSVIPPPPAPCNTVKLDRQVGAADSEGRGPLVNTFFTNSSHICVGQLDKDTTRIFVVWYYIILFENNEICIFIHRMGTRISEERRKISKETWRQISHFSAAFWREKTSIQKRIRPVAVAKLTDAYLLFYWPGRTFRNLRILLDKYTWLQNWKGQN